MLKHLRKAVSSGVFWEALPPNLKAANADWQTEFEQPRRRNEKRFGLKIGFQEALNAFLSLDRGQMQ
jgi:hypothetical protein